MEMTWYLADLVTEERVEGADLSRVHFDLHLVLAASGAEAYEKALRIGGGKASQHLREDGSLRSFIFRGLNDLMAVDEEFGDGARILSRSQPELTEEEIRHVVTPREYLRAIQAEGPEVGTETIQ
jgi:hypothetical protein